MTDHRTRLLTLLMLSGALVACAPVRTVIIETEPYPYPGSGSRDYDDYSDDYPHTHGIPPGHLPPPGECRIWFPGLPPGQQPPPGDCAQLQYHVPRGALFIRG